MHFDVVLSVFIHPCSKTAEESSVDTASVWALFCVCACFRCVCVRVLQVCVCARASDVCVCARASDVCVCVCARTSDVCVCVRFSTWKTSHTARDCYSNNPKRFICSPRAFGQSLYRVLTREIERECTRWL